jgi:hypothetical protein
MRSRYDQTATTSGFQGDEECDVRGSDGVATAILADILFVVMDDPIVRLDE